MEVNEGNINEAIIYLGKIKDILWPNISNAKYKVYEEKIINIMALLNELRKLKSLESKNKALKKENKAYKGILKEFKEYLDDDIARNTYDYDTLEVTEHYQKQITHLQIKYLGGGE